MHVNWRSKFFTFSDYSKCCLVSHSTTKSAVFQKMDDGGRRELEWRELAEHSLLIINDRRTAVRRDTGRG